MIVSPELISASSAPCASPLNSCERKLGQLIIAGIHPSKRAGVGPRANAHVKPRTAKAPSAVSSRLLQSLGIRTEVAAERVGCLHQRRPRDDLDDLVEVFSVLHFV